MDLKNRVVAGFRCHIDPMIGGKPKNSFDIREFKDRAKFELTPIGVYVRVWMVTPGSPAYEMEHVVPYANIQSIRLAPVVEEISKKGDKPAKSSPENEKEAA